MNTIISRKLYNDVKNTRITDDNTVGELKRHEANKQKLDKQFKAAAKQWLLDGDDRNGWRNRNIDDIRFDVLNSRVEITHYNCGKTNTYAHVTKAELMKNYSDSK